LTNTSLAASDPRFSALVREGDDDLSDKSVYMNILRALLSLSKYPFTDHFRGGSWSYPGYKDVAITVEPDPRLQINYAMWGLQEGLTHMGVTEFRALELRMYWNSGAGPKRVGAIIFQRSTPEQLGMNESAAIVNSITLGPLLDISSSSVSLPIPTRVSTVLELTSGTALSPPIPKSPFSSYPISINSTAYTSFVDIPNAHLAAFFELEGARLPKYDIFACICEGIVTIAGIPRSEPFRAIATITSYSSTIEIQICPWNVHSHPELAQLLPEDVIYLLGKIPIYMEARNKFQEGTFVLEKDGAPM